MNRTFAEKLKLLKEKQGILPCYAIRVEKHQKHPVVFEKAPVLFLKALDLLKKRPVTNDRKNIKTGCTNHLIQPVFIFIRLYTTD